MIVELVEAPGWETQKVSGDSAFVIRREAVEEHQQRRKRQQSGAF